MEDLKLCPCCGAPAEPVHTRSGDDFVRCTCCRLRTRQYHENDVGPAEDWNRRVEVEGGRRC